MSCEFVIRVVQEFQTWVCCVVKTLLGGGVSAPMPHQNLLCTEKKKMFAGPFHCFLWVEGNVNLTSVSMRSLSLRANTSCLGMFTTVRMAIILWCHQTKCPLSDQDNLSFCSEWFSQEVHESEKEKEVFKLNNCGKSVKSHLLNCSIQLLSYSDQVLVPILYICKHEMARQYGVNNLMYD